MQIREDTRAWQKMLDMMRGVAMALLILHLYYYCYGIFEKFRLTGTITDRILLNIVKTGLYNNPYNSKLLSLGFLLVSFLGVGGRQGKSDRSRLLIFVGGLVLYFLSVYLLNVEGNAVLIGVLYLVINVLGFIFLIVGGTLISGMIRNAFGWADDPGSGFLQEERLITNLFALNLRARYKLDGRYRKSWINIVNARRGVLVLGSPGAGKSWFIIENMIRQLMANGFSMLVYDFKYPTLTSLVYNLFISNRFRYPAQTEFYCINFKDIWHRCNVIEPSTMEYIADAVGASRTIMLSMNRVWVNKQGDFFVESAINFLAAVIWWLRQYENGKYCTLPHAIELSQAPYDKLFTLLGANQEISTLINPFIIAYKDKVMETLDSQVSSAKIPMGRLASPELYYVLTGNDLSLDINNPQAPKILCLGGDPVKQEALAPVLSLYIDRVNKLINQQGKYRCAVICDEFATVRAAGVLTTIASARSNDIIPIVSVQDLSQLRTQYSHTEADLVMNIMGNLICGQVGGETARWVSNRFPEIFQYKHTVSVNSRDTTYTKSEHLENPVSQATIATLSSGEFVGIVADDPGQLMPLKAFHAQVMNDHRALAKERANCVPLPIPKKVDAKTVLDNFQRIKDEVSEIVSTQGGKIMGNPRMEGVVAKGVENYSSDS